MTAIIGHDAVFDAFGAAARSGRLHHAWLLGGAQGLGKARVAALLARFLLVAASDPSLLASPPQDAADHPAGRLFDAHTHPDFVLVERLPKDPKQVKEVARPDWPEDLERVRNITIDQIRALGQAFALKPALSERRVVLIDSVDDLERSAANALLKNLEEPPAGTVFLLVSHAPGRLLPTIRSRCRTMRFGRLSDAEMQAVVGSLAGTLPDKAIARLLQAADGIPGRALALAELGLPELDAAIETIATTGDPQNRHRLALAASLSAKSAAGRYLAFLERVPAYVHRRAIAADARAIDDLLDVWQRCRSISDSAVRQSLEASMTVLALSGELASLAVTSGRVKG